MNAPPIIKGREPPPLPPIIGEAPGREDLSSDDEARTPLPLERKKAGELDSAREPRLAGAVRFGREVREARFLALRCAPRGVFDCG